MRGNRLSINSLRHILHNDRYLGTYRYADVVIEDGMPQLIDRETFDKVQRRFKENKRMGPHGANRVEDDEPRYWLTGKLCCGECKESMHGMCGTGKHVGEAFYYACKNHRRRKGSERWCPKRNVRKDFIEERVTEVLRHILADTENRA